MLLPAAGQAADGKEQKETTGKGRCLHASVTVFFTLLSVSFMVFFLALLEAVHYQGARAQTANDTDMANYSVFAEYEKKLLENYELFAVDASYGSGDFHIGRVEDRLRGYIRSNLQQDGLLSLMFDPWKISLTSDLVTDYALLTDRGGAAFYQQAAAYMKKTAVTQAAGRLLSLWQQAQQAERSGELAEQAQAASDQAMSGLEQESARRREELEQQEEETGIPAPQENRSVRNPLTALGRLRRMDLLDLLCPGTAISGSHIHWGEVPFERFRKSGGMHLPSQYGGLTDDLLFREYLLGHFGCFGKPKENTRLQYEIEYILSGRYSDRDNLRSTLKKLVALREGCNYLALAADMNKNAQAEALAALLIGWTGLPQLIEILKHALLLGWAYGESLMDVRALMAGGRVPVFKQEGDWQLSLEQLASTGLLLAGAGGSGEGASYRDYLRILLNLQLTGTQKKRGLNLIELNMKMVPGLSTFRVDHCVVAMKDETSWTIRPLFAGGLGVFAGISVPQGRVQVKGGFAY